MGKEIHIIKIFVLLLLAGALFGSQPLEGQIVFGQPPAGDAKFVLQSWTITDTADAETSLTQWVIPIAAFVPVRDNMEVIVTSSTASSSQDIEGGESNSLNGLNDTRVALYGSLFEDRFMWGVGLNLPTGKKALNNEEIGIVNILTEEFLNYPIKNYGEGFGLNIEGGYARSFDIYTVGIGAGYIFKTSYEPLDGVEDYKPGNILRTGGYASFKSEGYRGNIAAVFHLFSDDELDGEPVFRDGNIIDLRLELALLENPASASIGFRQLIRGKEKRIIGGEFMTEPEKSRGDESRVSGRAGYAVNENMTIRLLLDYKRVAANGYDDEHVRSFGSSNYFGIGFGGSAILSEVLHGFGEFEYFSGNADDSALDLSGWQIAIGAGATF